MVLAQSLVDPPREERQKAQPIDPGLTPEEHGWEFDFAAKHDILYPALRTLGALVPFASFGFPSYREEFAKKSIGWKALDLGVDVATLLPLGVIGKGVKFVSKPITLPLKKAAVAGYKKLPFRLKPLHEFDPDYLGALTKQFDSFVYEKPNIRLMKKYGLEEDEANYLLGGWYKGSGRSGAKTFWGEPGGDIPTESLRRFFTPKTGKLLKKYKEELEEIQLPPKEQLRNFKTKEWENMASKYIPEDKRDMKALFDRQIERMYGKKYIGKVTRENISDYDLNRVMLDMFLNQNKVARRIDAGIFHYFQPVRKTMMQFADRLPTMKIYNRMVKMFGYANETSMQYVDRFKLLLMSRDLIVKRPHFPGYKRLFTRQDLKKAGEHLEWIDDAQGKGNPQSLIQKKWDELRGGGEEPSLPYKLAFAYHEWTDHMYGELIKELIPDKFRSVGLTKAGRQAVHDMFYEKGAKARERIEALFNPIEHRKAWDWAISTVTSKSAGLEQYVKQRSVAGLLKGIRTSAGRHPEWFVGPDEQAKLLQKLTFNTEGFEGGLPTYLESYMGRLYKKGVRSKAATVSPKEMLNQPKARFMQERTKGGLDEPVINDVFELVISRAREQGKQIFVYNELGPIYDMAKTLPAGLRSYVGHYLHRSLGMASPVDKKIGNFLGRWAGSSWDERKVMRAAWRVNDLVYMGGIGLKPFSAMRNLFQAPLMVPADMGGVKDYYWMARGFARALKKQAKNAKGEITQKSTYQELKEMGAITEFAPDILFRPKLPRPGVKLGTIKGKEYGLAQTQSLRDATMWMFKKSDEWNRVWTGASAMEKWDTKFNKLLKPIIGSKKGMFNNLKTFKKEVKISTREPYVRQQLDQLLNTGKFDEARKMYVKDVIADTQYLYGALDSPLIGQVGGVVSRSAVVFQSWWMNYASTITKWLTRSKDVPQGTDRMMTWFISSFMLAQLAEKVWGVERAKKAVFLGPLPTQLDLPAGWRPLAEAMELVKVLGEEAASPEKDPEKVKSQLKALFRSKDIYIPGGLQWRNVWKGRETGGLPGFLQATMGYQPRED